MKTPSRKLEITKNMMLLIMSLCFSIVVAEVILSTFGYKAYYSNEVGRIKPDWRIHYI